MEKKFDGNYMRMLRAIWTSPGGNTPQSSSCTATYLPSRKLSKTNQTCRTLLEKQRRAHKWCSPMDLLTWPSKSRSTSSNLHTAALWGYEMGGVAREGQGYPCWWHDKMIIFKDNNRMLYLHLSFCFSLISFSWGYTMIEIKGED